MAEYVNGQTYNASAWLIFNGQAVARHVIPPEAA